MYSRKINIIRTNNNINNNTNNNTNNNINININNNKVILTTISDDRFGRKGGKYSQTQDKILNFFKNNPNFDIVVFVHDDVSIIDKQIFDKLKQAHTQYDIVGVAGGINPIIRAGNNNRSV